MFWGVTIIGHKIGVLTWLFPTNLFYETCKIFDIQRKQRAAAYHINKSRRKIHGSCGIDPISGRQRGWQICKCSIFIMFINIKWLDQNKSNIAKLYFMIASFNKDWTEISDLQDSSHIFSETLWQLLTCWQRAVLHTRLRCYFYWC